MRIPRHFSELAATLLVAALFSSCTKGDPAISGTITMRPEFLKKIAPDAVLYLIARDSRISAGPPIAVKRWPQPLGIGFPMSFTISAKDSMLPNTPFEGPLKLVARVSQLGTPTPINAGDMEGTLADPVAVGSKDVRIDINQMK